MADHVRDRYRSFLVDDRAVRSKAHGRDARGIDNAADPGFPRQPQQGLRAFDVGGIHCFGIGNPQPVIGGNVDQCVASGHRTAKIFRLQQIAGVRALQAILRDVRCDWSCGSASATRLRLRPATGQHGSRQIQ